MPTKDEPAASTANEFAMFLAKLSSAAAPAIRNDRWDDSSLADDVATISGEQALQNSGRNNLALSGNFPIQTAQATWKSEPSAEPSGGVEAHKSASISIRLTRSECAQLRQRAAEAGLTISDYLRSCIFEVESLRTQVREVLLRVRPASSNSSAPPTPPSSTPRSPKSKARWFWPFGNETPSARLESRWTVPFTRPGAS
jgi:hypothetical protein